MSVKEGEEFIWVCPACKKADMEEILLGKWRLVGMVENEDIRCGICEDDKKIVNG